ncbi:MAG: flavodoxin [Bacteroidales bacterium]|nr:flavodoxin [Bacteroidales bacterium]
MNKTAVIYSFNTKNSAKVAEKVKDAFGKSEIDTLNAEELTEDQFLAYDNLILSVPTWFDGELPNYWDEFVPAIEDMNLKGKTFAIFGLGDQKGYPENFGDAIGIMTNILEKQGAKVIGETSTKGYTYENSRGVRNNKFVGLMLDAENQDDLTDERVKTWVKEIKKKFG